LIVASTGDVLTVTSMLCISSASGMRVLKFDLLLVR